MNVASVCRLDLHLMWHAIQLHRAEQILVCFLNVEPAGPQGQLKVKDAVAAARLEEEWQMQEWGLVEGGHDIDIADINVRVAAPALFLQHLRR